MIQPEENHVDELSIFTPPPANTAIQRREWFEYRPVNQILDYASLDFLVPPQAAGYMDLKRSTLRVKVRLTDGDDKPISKDENVALVNLPLHSLFTQVDCSLQQTGVGQTGANYAYKAYIDTLLSTGANDRVELNSQSFVKDTSGHFDDANVRDGSNTGLYIRSIYTDSGKILEMEGPIHLDIFRQNRLIVNGSVSEIPSEQECLSAHVERRKCCLQNTDRGRQFQAVRTETKRRSIDGSQQITPGRDCPLSAPQEQVQDRFLLEWGGVQSQPEQSLRRRSSIAADRGARQ